VEQPVKTVGRRALAGILFAGWIGSALAQAPDFAYWEVDSAGNGRVAIGDIDADGRNDIALHTWNGDISWYKYPAWDRHQIASGVDEGGDEIQLADIDGDGDLDLVGPWKDRTRLYWFENPGKAAAASAQSWRDHAIDEPGSLGKRVKDLRILDLDGDGRLDAVARRHDQLTIHFQITPAQWASRTIDIVEREGMDLGDIDGDGDQDVLLNGFWLEHPQDPRTGTWQRHNIDSTWYTMGKAAEDSSDVSPSKPEWRDNAAKVVVTDIDKDGRADVVVSAAERTEPDWPIAWYRTTDPKAGPDAWTREIIGYLPNAHTLQVADFDLDGDLDVLACRLRDGDKLPLYVFANEGNDWRKLQIHEGGCYSGKVGDIDNDGNTDFVSSRHWREPPLYLMRNQRDPGTTRSFALVTRHLINALPYRSVFVESGDLDGDGLTDLIAAGHWWKNPGALDGKWRRFEIGAPFANVILVRDFDGDGHLDVLGTQENIKGRSPQFAWTHNDGFGRFRVFTNLESAGTGSFLQGRAIADFGKGREIALAWNNGGGGVYALRVPQDPVSETWRLRLLSETTQGVEPRLDQASMVDGALPLAA